MDQHVERRCLAQRRCLFAPAAFAVTLFLSTCAAALTYGQEEPGGATPTAKPEKSFFVWVWEAEGIFFFPQLGLSIGVVAIIISNFIAIRRGNFCPDDFVSSFENYCKEKKFKEAFDLAKKDESFVGRMLAAALPRLQSGYPEAIEGMQELGEEEDMKYEHRLSYLALIGNIATLVGLLGTVWGMVASFMEIGKSDVAPKPSALAQGVSQALLTTIIGLIQAIPAIVCFTILKNKVAKLVLEVGIISERLMQPFKAVSVRRPAEAAQPAAAS